LLMSFGKFLSPPKLDTKFQRAPERFSFTTDWFCGNEKHFSKYLPHLEDTPCQLLEIGCYEGRATVWLLEHIATHPDATIKCIDIAEQASFRQNILAARSPEKVRLEIGRSRNLLRSYPANAFDFVYVDGDHGTVNVLEDAVLSFILLKRNGIMAFDDFKWKDRTSPDGTPKQAINAFLMIYRRKITVLMKDYQVWIRKDED
ncbi:MAG: class I SAM-dependent methyltransferase, partial [Methylocella sp.]